MTTKAPSNRPPDDPAAFDAWFDDFCRCKTERLVGSVKKAITGSSWEVAEDAVQFALDKFWQRRGRAADGRLIENAFSYCYTVARNQAIGVQKRRGTETELWEEGPADSSDEFEVLVERIANKEKGRRLLETLCAHREQLTNGVREVTAMDSARYKEAMVGLLEEFLEGDVPPTKKSIPEAVSELLRMKLPEYFDDPLITAANQKTRRAEGRRDFWKLVAALRKLAEPHSGAGQHLDDRIGR